MKHVVGYLAKMKHAMIRFRVGKLDMSAFDEEAFGWEQSVYGKVTELIPTDAPEPKGKPVVMLSFVNANLMHDVTTGRSVTGILHFLNKTLINFYSKKQATVETATYGSEFVAAQTAMEQMIDLQLML